MVRKVLALAMVALLTTVVAIRIASDDQVGAEASPSIRETVMKHEDLIAECMHIAGFRYVVAPPADLILEEIRQEAVGAGKDPQAAIASAQIPANPNTAILNALSPREQEAYADAYWGPGTDHKHGCYYETYRDAWGIDVDTLLVGQRDLAEIEGRIAKDPKIQQAKSEYVACMLEVVDGIRTFEDIQTYRGRKEAEVVGRIETELGEKASDEGGTGIPSDHPLWKAYLQELKSFDNQQAVCEPSYLQTVQPIENQYLSGN